ncbi:glycosyltransferase family 4 protein [Bacteroidota bacterium]
MKILMLLENDFPPDNRVEKEAMSLIRAGHEVSIASYTFKQAVASSDYKSIRLFKREISRFQYKSSSVALRFPFYFRFWKKYIRELFQTNEFDLIHVHDLPLIKVGLYFKRKYGVKLIIDLHENYPALVEGSPYSQRFPGRILISIKQWRRYEKKYLPEADGIITVIDEMADRISGLGVDRLKISIVSNTPDLASVSYAESSPDPGYTTLLYAGGITFHRGLQIVLMGLHKIIQSEQSVRLWVVGDGSYFPVLKKLVNDLDISDYVTFWGWKPFDEMLQLQAKCDIALIPHLKTEQSDNSSPNKIYEYMWNKKAILSSNCNSIIRLLNLTEAGITYIHDDPQSFADTFFTMMKSGDLKELGQNGHKAVRDIHNWQETEKELISLYNRMN